MKIKKKAQAAMEFLMTYGWALLVVLIAIAALAFFGVLNPARLLPSSCSLGVGFACEDFKVINSDPFALGAPGIALRVRNGMGKNLEFFTLYIDVNAQKCAGIIGIIVASPSNPFADGAAERIRTYGGGNPFNMFCINNFSPFKTCCNDPLYLGIGFGCPNPGFSGCVTEPALTVGTKFKADIVIQYREVGSTLIHSRVGQLITQVEARTS